MQATVLTSPERRVGPASLDLGFRGTSRGTELRETQLISAHLSVPGSLSVTPQNGFRGSHNPKGCAFESRPYGWRAVAKVPTPRASSGKLTTSRPRWLTTSRRR